jgi:hypothetical protein
LTGCQGFALADAGCDERAVTWAVVPALCTLWPAPVLRLTCCIPPLAPQIAAGYHQLQPPLATAGPPALPFHSNRRRVTSNTAEGVHPPTASDCSLGLSPMACSGPLCQLWPALEKGISCSGQHWIVATISSVRWPALACYDLIWPALACTGLHWSTVACTGSLPACTVRSKLSENIKMESENQRKKEGACTGSLHGVFRNSWLCG